MISCEICMRAHQHIIKSQWMAWSICCLEIDADIDDCVQQYHVYMKTEKLSLQNHHLWLRSSGGILLLGWATVSSHFSLLLQVPIYVFQLRWRQFRIIVWLKWRRYSQESLASMAPHSKVRTLQESEEWDVKHITSSLHYTLSNSFIE